MANGRNVGTIVIEQVVIVTPLFTILVECVGLQLHSNFPELCFQCCSMHDLLVDIVQACDTVYMYCWLTLYRRAILLSTGLVDCIMPRNQR